MKRSRFFLFWLVIIAPFPVLLLFGLFNERAESMSTHGCMSYHRHYYDDDGYYHTHTTVLYGRGRYGRRRHRGGGPRSGK